MQKRVTDLQAVDADLPSDLGEILRRNDGDLTPLAGLAKKAPASARRSERPQASPACWWLTAGRR